MVSQEVHGSITKKTGSREQNVIYMPGREWLIMGNYCEEFSRDACEKPVNGILNRFPVNFI